MSDISSFPIQNPKQIINHLSLLLKNKCLLSARFGSNNESYITTLLDINEENNTVVLDCGPKEDLNQHMLNAGKATFETEYKGIKVSFIVAALKKIAHKGEPAFSTPIPKLLFWMQRREHYRVKVPVSNSSHCQLILKDRETINLELYDISLSGLSMLNDSEEVSDLLVPGTSLAQGKLILSEAGEGMVSFEICAKIIINPDKLKKLQKIGCKFIRIPSTFEATVQRYINQLQRESIQKMSGRE